MKGSPTRLPGTPTGKTRATRQFTYATADTVLCEGDVIVVAGATSSAERFATLD